MKLTKIEACGFKSFADPGKITEVVIVAVVSPLAVVPFENELSQRTTPGSVDEAVNLSFEAEANFEREKRTNGTSPGQSLGRFYYAGFRWDFL